jgi:hypothetical protein
MTENKVSMKFFDKLTGECESEKQYYKHIWLRDGEIVFDKAGNRIPTWESYWIDGSYSQSPGPERRARI